MDQWANPQYMHPWYLPFEAAYALWHDPALDSLREEVVPRGSTSA